MNIAYQGPLLDYSGYGEANRHFVAALISAGVGVTGQLLAYSKERSDYGTLGPIIHGALENHSPYRIKIMHTTPDEIARLSEPGKYQIAHFFWETDRLPDVFVKGLNAVDEVWTGSQANYDAMVRSGVTKPIFIFPQPIETVREWPAKYELPDFNGYLFYSIFEWTDRKNPEALIDAFYSEFSARDNVGLLIKTYFRNFTLNNKRMIRDKVLQIKERFGKQLPPIFLYLDLMDRQQIMRLHVTGDCYVTPHRGEGWGVPIVEALLDGKPVITTAYGGVNEYLTPGVDAMLLDYNLVPLRGMSHSGMFYSSDQKWADINPEQLQNAMRFAFEKPEAAKVLGNAGRAFVEANFNLERVGGLMKARLEEIEKNL